MTPERVQELLTTLDDYAMTRERGGFDVIDTGTAADARDLLRELLDKRVLTCAFCGRAYPPSTPPTQHAALTQHVHECTKHPLRARIVELEARIVELEARLKEAK